MQRLLFLTIISMILASCAQLPTPQQNVDQSLLNKWTAHQQDMQKLLSWSFKGRLGGRSAFRAYSASINWQQRTDTYYIHLSGPLGQGSIKTQGNIDHIRIHSPTKGFITSNNPKQLLYDELGVLFPIAKAASWIKGDPNQSLNHLDEFRLNEKGHLTYFKDQDWEISYYNYRSVDSISLPHKIIFRFLENKVTIIIKDWHT